MPDYALVAFIVLTILCVLLPMLIFSLSSEKKDAQQNIKQQPEESYAKPQLKPLTAEQIAEIHSRGKITPAEAVNEWEKWDLCVPGDAIGSASWRCRKFRHNCHDCLIDFASNHDEYTSIYRIGTENRYNIKH